MPRIGPFGIWELLIILLVVLLIFGARRLPEVGKGIGESVREFRNGIREARNEAEVDPAHAGRNGAAETAATNESS